MKTYKYFENIEKHIQNKNCHLKPEIAYELREIEESIMKFTSQMKEIMINQKFSSNFFTNQQQGGNSELPLKIAIDKVCEVIDFKMTLYFEIITTSFNTIYNRKIILINNKKTTQTAFKGLLREIKSIRNELKIF